MINSLSTKQKDQQLLSTYYVLDKVLSVLRILIYLILS